MYQFNNSFSKATVATLISLASVFAAVPALSQTAQAPAVESGVVPAPVLTREQQVGQEIAALLEAGGEATHEFIDFYAARDNQPIWAGDNRAILDLLTAIEQAPAHGLPLARYNTAAIETAWNGSGAPADIAALEVAAAMSYVQFAKDLTAGMLNPKSINREMNSEWRVPETATVLANVAAATDKQAFYKTLQPSSPEYELMLAEKRRLEKLVAANSEATLVPSGRTLRPGHSNARVVALRARLNFLGYEVDDLTSPEYDDGIIEAVKAFQADAGLNTDGLVGPKTLAAVNAGPEQHLKQVVVNLERLRWMNFDLGKRHIYVNIPDYTASVIDDGKPTLSFRVVVGTARNQTAEFSDVMTHMVINPSWNVPMSIASKEYLPKLLADPSTLARQNIQMRVRGSGQVVDSTAVDYTQYSTGNFPFVLRQLPGSNNALGRVKFMFPNKFNIYLHDTPSRSLFNRDARAFSHGCVRVQKPLELAYTLLAPQEADPQAKFDSILATRRETQVDLAEPIPVHLVYRTAFFDDSGEINYRADIYRRDKMVFDALVKAGVTIPGLDG